MTILSTTFTTWPQPMLQRCYYYCDTTSAARMLLLLQCNRHPPCRDVTANGPLHRNHCQHCKDARAITFSPPPTLQRCCYCDSTFTNANIMTSQPLLILWCLRRNWHSIARWCRHVTTSTIATCCYCYCNGSSATGMLATTQWCR